MILLKQTFCWDWVDVLYFVTNQRVDHKVRNTLRTSDLNSWNLDSWKLAMERS